MSAKTRLLIFSKDRAVQLLALLESLKCMCQDIGSLDIVVLARTTSPKHKRQYDEIEPMFPFVYFYPETDLAANFLFLLLRHEYIAFFVDDSICVRSFNMSEAVVALEENIDSLGFSLRLGKNITYSYPHSCPQDKPVFTDLDNSMMKLNWTKYKCDFGYPMELSSSLYRVSDIDMLLHKAKMINLQHIENSLWYNSQFVKDTKPNLLSFTVSRVFSNPMNITGSNSTNRFSKDMSYSVDEMAKKFDEGYKIDISPFADFTPIGCHQEVPYTWIRR